MGQAKARGSKDERVSEALKLAAIIRKENKMADELARAKALAEAREAQAARDKENEERLARGEKPLPRLRRRDFSGIIALAAIGAMTLSKTI